MWCNKRSFLHVMTLVLWINISLFACTANCSSFFGEAGKMYILGEKIDVVADSYRSPYGLFPYSYNYIPMCRTTEKIPTFHYREENLGEIILGHRPKTSAYEFNVGDNLECRELCTKDYSKWAVQRATTLIKNNYSGRMYLDGLPVVMKDSSGKVSYGYDIGILEKDNDAPIFFNHFEFRIGYTRLGINNDKRSIYGITKFGVIPRSLDSNFNCDKHLSEISTWKPFRLTSPEIGKVNTVHFTYSVVWVEEDKDTYKNRWDFYFSTEMKTRLTRAQVLAAIFSLGIALFLGFVVAIVFLSTIRKDLRNGPINDDELDVHEVESGWRLISGDVFRAPRYRLLFTAIIGGGCQLLSVIAILIVAMIFRWWRITHTGHFLTAFIICFILSTICVGFVVGVMLKFFHLESWKNGMKCVFFLPLTYILWYMLLNNINWWKHSSSAIPFTTLLYILFLWLVAALPLSVAGLFLGFRRRPLSAPARVNTLPRLIPYQQSLMQRYFYLLGGIVPFVAFFIELNFLLNTLWEGEYFYLFGGLCVVAIIVFLVCAEMGVIVTYLTLNKEDYRWWWRSFTAFSSSGLFVFMYSIIYWWMHLRMRYWSSIILYLGYSFGIAVMFSLLAGTVGFLASAVFVWIIYSVAKVEEKR